MLDISILPGQCPLIYGTSTLSVDASGIMRLVKINLRLLYLYLFSFVGLLIVVIGSIRLVDLGLKVFVFKDADKFEYVAPARVDGEKQMVDVEEEKRRSEREWQRQRQREFTGSMSMIAVGLPLYLYHWKMIQKEHKREI